MNYFILFLFLISPFGSLADNICDGSGSTACSGTLYDCGGPTMDYGSDETYVYTICPTDPHQCILLDLIDFSIENGFDFLNIYAGDNTSAPLLTALTGVSNGSDFQIQVSSACVTFEFISDDIAQQPGFELNWLCTAAPCAGSSAENPASIGSLPFNDVESTCGEGSSLGISPCFNDDFLMGPDYFYTFETTGGSCISIDITNADLGTNVLVLDGPPNDPNTNCVRVGQAGNIGSVDVQVAGTYYIIVANGGGCTDFEIDIQEAECKLSPTLADAICNPLNGCRELDANGNALPSTFVLDLGFEDIQIIPGINNGCYLNTGAGNFYWFSIQAAANGPFGFIVDGANFDSDIDVNVYGPFTEQAVCEAPETVIDYIRNNQPIRSTWTNNVGAPTGLVDIHPVLGTPVTDEFDCGGLSTPGPGGDDFVSTIPAQAGEVYVILFNDFSGNISDGIVEIDWSPSDPFVLDPQLEIIGQDTMICAGTSANLSINSVTDNIRWINNTQSLSCTNCPNPIAIPDTTTSYLAVINSVCIEDTVEVRVQVWRADAGVDTSTCLGATIQLHAEADTPVLNYEWIENTPGELSCINCADPILTTSSVGTFSYQVNVTTAECILQDEVSITVLNSPLPNIGLVADTIPICLGDSIRLGQMSNSTDFLYEWSADPIAFTSNDPNPSITPNQSATYFVEVATSLCPSTIQDTVYVEVVAAPILDLVSDTIYCFGAAPIILNAAPANPNITYEWTSDPIDNTFNNTLANPPVSPSVSTNYSLWIPDNVCFENPVEVFVEVPEPATIMLSSDTVICATELPIELTASSDGDDRFFTWDTGEASPNITVAPDQTTSYTLTYDDQCSPPISRTVTVEVLEAIEEIFVDPAPADTLLFAGQSFSLMASTEPPLTNPFYLWNTGDENARINTIIPSVPSIDFSVTISNDGRCPSELTVTYMVEEASLDLPNIFTPNGDGISDYFNFDQKGEVEVLEFRVYTRWGTLVYDNQTPDTGWDGRYKGEVLPTDVYLCYVVYQRPSGQELLIKKDVTLVR